MTALDHVTQCHINTFLENIQRQWLHHLPGQPAPKAHCFNLFYPCTKTRPRAGMCISIFLKATHRKGGSPFFLFHVHGGKMGEHQKLTLLCNCSGSATSSTTQKINGRTKKNLSGGWQLVEKYWKNNTWVHCFYNFCYRYSTSQHVNLGQLKNSHSSSVRVETDNYLGYWFSEEKNYIPQMTLRSEGKIRPTSHGTCSLLLPDSVWVCSPAISPSIQSKAKVTKRFQILSYFLWFISLSSNYIVLYCAILHSNILFCKLTFLLKSLPLFCF